MADLYSAMSLLLGFALGISAGLRSMTPAAVTAWAAQLGWPDLRQTSLAFMASPITAWIFTLFAGVELVFDKLPSTPSRLGAGPLGARIVMGALCSATAVRRPTSRSPSVRSPAPLAEWPARSPATTSGGISTMNLKVSPLHVAVAEDCLAIGIAAFAVSRFL